MAKNDDKLKALLQQAEQGIKDVFESDRYRNYLAIMSKFHSYSFRNNLLILMQKPEASYVAGYSTWQKKFNRQVRRGEKGIQIIGYAPKKVNIEQEKKNSNGEIVTDTKGNPEKEIVCRQIPYFTPVYVYDISQTEGEPLPQLINELDGSVAAYQDLIQAIAEVSPFPISFENIKGDAKGFCDPLTQRIVIQQGMSEVQSIKTAIHEVTHADLHAPEVNLSLSDRTDRRTREVEAESVAYTVCQHYGLDTSDYSFGYVAGWSSSKELKELHNSLEIIQKQAGELINKIDNRLAEIQKNRDQMIARQSDPNKIEKSNCSPNRTFSIYQLKNNEISRTFKIQDLNYEMYDLVYSGSLPEGTSLDNIFAEFNTNHPADFTEHNLSIGDIITIEFEGKLTAYYVDVFDFKSLPDFARIIENKRQENILDTINNDQTIAQALPKKKTNIKERMAAAQAKANHRNKSHNNKKVTEQELWQNKKMDERGKA